MAFSIFFEQFSLSKADKTLIITSWWPVAGNINIADYDSYFDFFHQELRIIPWMGSLPAFAVRTLEDIMAVVRILSKHQAQPRSDIIKELHHFFPGQEKVAIIRSMELAARLWLGLNVLTWSAAVPSRMPRSTHIQWADNMSLVDMTEQVFQPSKNELGKQRSRISAGFTAWGLIYLCNVEIEWTDSLSDHLHFHHGSRILKIYRHKICLKAHWLAITRPQKDQYDKGKKDLESGDRVSSHMKPITTSETDEIHEAPSAKGIATEEKLLQSHENLTHHAIALCGSPLPRDLLEETMRTLDLLFPFTGDEDTRLFLESQGQSFNQIRTPAGLGLQRALDFSEFKYWRDKLEDIYDVFNSPPQTKRQLWRDRRNKRDFWTLVISFLALGLAIVLGVCGLVSAMQSNELAKKSLGFAQWSFDLDLAQACGRQDMVNSMCSKLPRTLHPESQGGHLNVRKGYPKIE